MKTAVLRQSERTRFEVQSIPLRGGQYHRSNQNQGIRWYMKANHPNEAKRWIEAIGRNIEYFRQRDREGGCESDTSSGRRRKSMESWSAESGFKFGMIPSTSNGSIGAQNVFWRSSSKDRDQESIVGSISGPSPIFPTPSDNSIPTFLDADPVSKDVAVESEREDADDESSDTRENELEPPHPNMELQGNSLTAQLEITNRLVENIIGTSQVFTTQTMQTHQVLTESLQTIQSHLSTFLHMTREREDWFTRQLRKERKRQKVWEESLAVVVKEGEGLERELRKRRGRGSTFLAVGGTQKERAGKRRASITALGTIKGVPTALSEEKVVATVTTPTPVPVPALASSKGTPISRSTTITIPSVQPPRPAAIMVTPVAPKLGENIASEEDDHDTDEEDEFFDAIETGNLPNLVVLEGLTSPKPMTSADLVTPRPSIHDMSAESKALELSDIRSLSVSDSPLVSKVISVELFAGYAALRNRLSIGDDDRPSTSLWSVLKHSIGKDLTKISFPVFFNEPTSMLQRMAEDMEFSECRKFLVCRIFLIGIKSRAVDVAAHEKDPLRRIAFVAAFAMSNYSSTIGRIAKPFNPMLVSVLYCRVRILLIS